MNKHAQSLAALSVQKRFGNMTKEERSEYMRKIAKKPRKKKGEYKKTTKERHCQLVLESQKRHKEKHLARQAVTRAVKRGDIPKVDTLLCEKCGEQAHCYDHAFGYEKKNQLRVVPMCWNCHRKVGVERGEYKNGAMYKKPLE